MSNHIDERTISLPLTSTAPSSARDWAGGERDTSAEMRQRMVLLISELVSNSVVHSGLVAPEEVDVSIRRIPRGLHVEVIDQGGGIETSPEPTRRHPSMGGYGLRLVDTMADRWGYSNHPTRVWFELMGEAAP
jgi:anti-sigma regulatory factor (Ser/Thr protein kinase)